MLHRCSVDFKIVAILVNMVLLSGYMLVNMGSYSSLAAHATTNVIDSVSISVRDTCTMSIQGDNGLTGEDGSTYSVSMQGGTTSTIVANSIRTFCNDAYGFKIYAIGYGDDIYGNTDLVYNNNGDYNIKTNGGNGSSYWKMKLENSNSNVNTVIMNNYDGFNVIPDSYTVVAQYNANTGNTNTTASVVTPSYQVYASGAQPAGTYVGKVKYTLVHPAAASTPEIPRCSGYDTMQNIANLKDAIFKQENEDQQVQLCDMRDEKIYWVARLKDGHIWMTQNLDYDIKSTGNEIASINAATTSIWNSPDGATSTELVANTGYTGTTSWDPGDYYIENGGSSSACDAWRPIGACGGTKAAVSLTSSSARNNESLHYHLGNYYQWNAATAGTGGTITNTNAAYSICPKGWRLPASNSYSDDYSLGKLTNAYGITNDAAGSSDAKLLARPLWFVRAGNIVSSSLGLQGTYGRIWSSLAHTNASLAYRLQFRSSTVDPLSNYNRNNGYSVRCVAL